jgi:cyclopropane-fatty-acyl-phospholipid synthase
MEQLIKQDQSLSYQINATLKGVSDKPRRLVFALLAKLNDATIDIIEGDKCTVFGDRQSALKGQIVVHDTSFYQDVVSDGSIGAAEAYVKGKWTSPELTKVIEVMARNQSQLDKIESQVRWFTQFKKRLLRYKNANTVQGSKKNILSHYDLGNALYSRFLDPAMQYSSAIYSDTATTLNDAQQLKLDIICQRLELKEDDQVIEIGTGWGGLAIYMAQRYGCSVTTTTISDAQHQYAKEQIEALGLKDKITLLKQDYRTLTGQYDKLVSIEMIEAVGHEYHATFFKQCANLLKDDGKMLIQAITIADGRYESYRKNVDFIQKYIFPGGCLPSIAVITSHLARNTDMVAQEVHDIGLHYARTLHDWRENFEKQWSSLIHFGYDEEFKRLWLFYLCYCEGAFLQRVISTHHIVARKPRYRGVKDETVLDY